jgi:hypothetical protein
VVANNCLTSSGPLSGVGEAGCCAQAGWAGAITRAASVKDNNVVIFKLNRMPAKTYL